MERIEGSNHNGKALSETSNIDKINQTKDLVMWDIVNWQKMNVVKNEWYSWLKYYAIFAEKTTCLICTEQPH